MKANESILNRFLNACIMIAALLLCVAAQRYFQGVPDGAKMDIPLGTVLNLGETVVAEGRNHLVLALSTTCRFCTDSASFYHRLATYISSSEDTDLIIVTPQVVDEGREYLQKLGIFARNIRHVDFSALGVPATPALMLVGPDLKVHRSWIGKLSTDQEDEVMTELQRLARFQNRK